MRYVKLHSDLNIENGGRKDEASTSSATKKCLPDKYAIWEKPCLYQDYTTVSGIRQHPISTEQGGLNVKY